MSRRRPRKSTGKTNRSAMDLQLKRGDDSPSWTSRIFGWRSETSFLVSGPARGNNSGLIGGAEGAREAMLRRGRRKRPSAGVVAVFSTLCAALLWAGASSFSRAQVPSGTGSNSTRRTSEVLDEYTSVLQYGGTDYRVPIRQKQEKRKMSPASANAGIMVCRHHTVSLNAAAVWYCCCYSRYVSCDDALHHSVLDAGCIMHHYSRPLGDVPLT